MVIIIISNPNKFWVEESKPGRLYCRKVGSETIKYPSVTTVMSAGSKHSSGCSPSASIGTIVHYHILRKFTKTPIRLPTEHIWNTTRSEVVGRVRRCLTMWEDLKLPIKPVFAETAIFNETPRYAGRMDLLCKLDGKLTLIDIKTGMHYNDHVMQAAGYWNALKRKTDVCFVYLDGIVDRNPGQTATIRYFTEDELTEGYEKFLDKYVELKIE